MKRKCIIIPAFNEENNIVRVINGVKEICAVDIVVIDDGSSDRTAQKSLEAGAYVISHPFNMGYGTALQTGYKYTVQEGYEWVVQIDGDGQHDPVHIPQLFGAVESFRCDVAIGSRFLISGEYKLGILKKFGKAVLTTALWMVIAKRMTDPTSGYQCLNRRVLKTLINDSFPSDYPDANIIIKLHRMGFTVKEIPVCMAPNPDGRNMHQGFFTLTYYVFKMGLSIAIALIQDK